MKLRKKNMRQFDYAARIIFALSVALFVLAFVFIQPKTQQLQQGNYLLTNQIAELENRNATLKREINELENPTTIMTADKDNNSAPQE
ncbi:MAG: hypothetical protein WC196_00490 [Bacilli bacterium]|jgi:cell division protein FtsL|nr:hypothetical protein [Bacilli bacterium]MDD3422253.1 hypothetical protein [Bacilli bacterium]MDD4065554.1 hypothetical protein [Bacilli bacterium]